MKCILNNEFEPYINNGTLNIFQIRCLVEIKEFVDRIAGRQYLDGRTVASLTEKYGATPTVTTWGDYFQTEIGFQLLGKSDEEFRQAVDTVKFDVISSHIIFTGKGIDFFEWVENNYQDYINRKDELSFREYEEIVHLKILKDYFVNLNITDAFTYDEMKWYGGYREAAAI